MISAFWGTGGDLNTRHDLIDEFAKRHCSPGTETALDALGKGLGCPTSAKDIPVLLKEPVPLRDGFDGVPWSLEEYSVGYVMAITLKNLLEQTNPQLLGQARLIIQGFGCVGATFAQAALELGIGRVVGISSQYGYLVDQNGIDVAAIDRNRRDLVARGQTNRLDPNCLEAGLLSSQIESTAYAERSLASTDEDHLATFLSASRGEVFVPCACRYILTNKVTQALVSKTFANLSPHSRFIVSGANNIFPQISSRDDCLRALDDARITMLPEWVSNSGTANLFMRTCSGLARPGRAADNLSACANDTASFLRDVFLEAKNTFKSSALWRSCDTVAAKRRARGATNVLGVKGIDHLTLISPDCKRSRETFTKIGNVNVLKDGILKLPGSDDPTLSITQAPQDAGPADTGLHVRFSVFNIEKTRMVLHNERVEFVEHLHPDGRTELELAGESAGYPMSFIEADQPTLDRGATMSNDASIVREVKQLDHYTLIVPDALAVKTFHERMMGYTHLRTIRLNAGAAPQGEEDMLNHVMALPLDTQRVLVITEGLIPESIFRKLLQKKRRPYIHHIALEVGDVESAFVGVRQAGWGTTSDKISKDMLSGLRQFFIKEEEAGCFLELIERGDLSAAATTDVKSSTIVDSADDRRASESSNSKGQGEFRRGNMASLAQSMESYVKDEA